MIKAGDKLPETTFTVMTADGPKPKTTGEIFKGKKVVLFAVPGAFTPTCHANHLPGFRDKASELKAKGVDAVECVAVNDVFVMDAWGKALNVGNTVEMLADGSGKFASAVGLTVDLSERGLGLRSKRYSMLVEDGVVKTLNVEEGPGVAASGVDNMLTQV